MAKKGGNEITMLIHVLEKGSNDKRDITIDDIISNPVSCGYLLDFCQKGYCAENLNFFMAVDKFKDECALLDFRDPESVTTCKEMADRIWQDYLSLNSPNEVSLPSQDREQTMERMKKPGEFRGKLFDVAMQDAIKTLQKDTLQRFLNSPQYNEMSAKVTQVHDLMVKKALEVDGAYQIDMPTKTTLTDDKIASTKEFSLDDILNDKILFSEMLEYLEKKFKAENLKCARQIRRFEELALEKKADDLKSFAWDVYLYFIAPGSPYEVSCTNLDRKSVQLRLGCPIKSMFEPIKENTMLVLKQDHKAFCAQIQAKTLKDRLKAEKTGSAPAKTSFLSKIKLF
uniref:RGS domain-containing protein n=1 Tax=Globisporangium ultimum (strain ATCC 200006 / CBS 805.95 / DAOM BR144) TaxID=431595 RepID=K3X4P2_GLOUD